MSSPKKESVNPTNSNNDDQIRRAQLQTQFRSTRREDFQTVETYVEKLKSIANSLAEMDSPISDSEMVFELLAGLPTQYKPFKKTITSTRPLPNFDEACSILYMQEDILLQIRRGQLQMQFHSTQREDFQTVEAYVEKLKSIANSLAEMDSPISDSEMVFELLAGLPTQYKRFKKTITSTRPLPNFDEACSMLYIQEGILFQEQSESKSAILTKEKFSTVMDTVGTVASVVATVGTVCAAAGPVGTVIGAVGTVSASRMIAAGAVGAISAMVGWKFGKQSDGRNSSS